MPLKDACCLDCGHRWEALLKTKDDAVACPSCSSTQVQYELGLFGGYSIKGNNSASVRPKQAGSFKK